MTRNARNLLMLAGLVPGLMSALPVPAQEDAVELPRYRVEVILFEHTSRDATPEDPGLPDLPPEPPLAEAESADSVVAEPTDPGEQPPGDDVDSIFYAPAEGSAMSDVADQLRRRSAYRVLLHQAWIQPGFDRTSARPVDLGQLARLQTRVDPDASGVSDNLLSASATFYLSRYLHLTMDATLGDDLGSQIRERRRMRIGELHYFDAPGIGAVATISRVEPAAESGKDP